MSSGSYVRRQPACAWPLDTNCLYGRRTQFHVGSISPTIAQQGWASPSSVQRPCSRRLLLLYMRSSIMVIMSSSSSPGYFCSAYSRNPGNALAPSLCSGFKCPAKASTCSTGNDRYSASILQDLGDGVCLPSLHLLKVDALTPDSRPNPLREIPRCL